MSKPVDPRSPAIFLAVQRAALVLLKRETASAEAIAVLAAAMAGDTPADVTPRENIKAVRRSRREKMLDELARHERRDRISAVNLVARAFAADKHDPVEVASLERKLRRWRDKRDEKNGHCPKAG
jgi:hypothetical protein